MDCPHTVVSLDSTGTWLCDNEDCKAEFVPSAEMMTILNEAAEEYEYDLSMAIDVAAATASATATAMLNAFGEQDEAASSQATPQTADVTPGTTEVETHWPFLGSDGRGDQ